MCGRNPGIFTLDFSRTTHSTTAFLETEVGGGVSMSEENDDENGVMPRRCAEKIQVFLPWIFPAPRIARRHFSERKLGEGVWRIEEMMIEMASCPGDERGKSRYFYLGFSPHYEQYGGILANGSWGRGYGGSRK